MRVTNFSILGRGLHYRLAALFCYKIKPVVVPFIRSQGRGFRWAKKERIVATVGREEPWRSVKTAITDHLIFQGRHYSSNYGKVLRDIFVYPLDINIHNQLHNQILHDIPKPSDLELRKMWNKYQQDCEYIKNFDIIEACEWLMMACDDPAWQGCMKRQWLFLKSALRGE